MRPFAYGLNVPAKQNRKPNKPTKTIFDDDGSESEGDPNVPDVAKGTAPTKSFANLSSAHSSKKHAQSAQEEDANIYDYDGVYNSLHAQPKKKEQKKGPKYMQSLLESAEVRKRDQLQAKDKMLAKEREAEGDLYADKEKFVTGAYKAQQEEVKRLAEEEKRREEEAAGRRRKAGGGMTGLYKNMLEREDERHAAIAQAVQKGQNESSEQMPDGGNKEQAEIALRAGATVNDDGQVIDKRQLLKAGLNITSKPKGAGSVNSRDTEPARSTNTTFQNIKGGSKAAVRERQTRMIEAQLEQSAKRAADDERLEEEQRQRAAQSKKSREDIGSAKERYLQRKRDAEKARQQSSGNG